MEAKSKAPTPAAPPIVETNPDTAHWDDVADVVVVGFGGAGAVTALEASDRGARVLVLERFQGGGATTISGGVLYAGGSFDRRMSGSSRAWASARCR